MTLQTNISLFSPRSFRGVARGFRGFRGQTSWRSFVTFNTMIGQCKRVSTLNWLYLILSLFFDLSLELIGLVARKVVGRNVGGRGQLLTETDER